MSASVSSCSVQVTLYMSDILFHGRSAEKRGRDSTLSKSSSVTCSGKSVLKDCMPRSAQALRFILTYVAESPFVPTNTTAKPGACAKPCMSVTPLFEKYKNLVNLIGPWTLYPTFPYFCCKSLTSSAISFRMLSAIALPSMIWADEGATAVPAMTRIDSYPVLGYVIMP